MSSTVLTWFLSNLNWAKTTTKVPEVFLDHHELKRLYGFYMLADSVGLKGFAVFVNILFLLIITEPVGVT